MSNLTVKDIEKYRKLQLIMGPNSVIVCELNTQGNKNTSQKARTSLVHLHYTECFKKNFTMVL
jgi:hypothetical protein